MNGPRPKLSQATLEGLVLAVLNLRTEEGMLIQLRPQDVLQGWVLQADTTGLDTMTAGLRELLQEVSRAMQNFIGGDHFASPETIKMWQQVVDAAVLAAAMRYVHRDGVLVLQQAWQQFTRLPSSAGWASHAIVWRDVPIDPDDSYWVWDEAPKPERKP